MQELFRFRGFWHYVRSAIGRDTELLLYFTIYTALLTMPLLVLFKVLSAKNNGSMPGALVGLLVGTVFFTNLVNRAFEFAVSFSIIQRHRGKNPNPIAAMAYVTKKFALIMKITGICVLYEIIQILIGAIIDSIFKHSRPASRFFTSLFFGTTDIAKGIFVGFLVPIAVSSDEEELSTLSAKTYGILKDYFLKSLSLNLKLALLGFVWIALLIPTVTVLPEYSKDSDLVRNSLILLLYSILPVGHFISLCTNLVYSQTVALILEDKKVPSEVKADLIGMGADPNTLR